jgi:hypothetical protein
LLVFLGLRQSDQRPTSATRRLMARLLRWAACGCVGGCVSVGRDGTHPTAARVAKSSSASPSPLLGFAFAR